MGLTYYKNNQCVIPVAISNQLSIEIASEENCLARETWQLG